MSLSHESIFVAVYRMHYNERRLEVESSVRLLNNLISIFLYFLLKMIKLPSHKLVYLKVFQYNSLQKNL